MHYDKFKTAGVQGVFRHCERYAKDGHYINFSNENIDTSRTHLNYDLGPGGNQYQRMKERLSQLSYRKQKNNTVLCGWVLTAPKGLEGEELERFFKRSYKFMEALYGKENVVSCYVHMDEGRPHMHFLWVPGTQEKKLSASTVTDRKVLSKIHDDLQKEIDREFGGHKYLVRSDDVAERATGSVPVDEFKKIMRELETRCELLKMDVEFFQNKAQQLEKIVQGKEDRIQSQNAQMKAQNYQIRAYATQIEKLKNEYEAKQKKSFFLDKEIKGKIEILEYLLDQYRETLEPQEIEQVEGDIAAAEGVLDDDDIELY